MIGHVNNESACDVGVSEYALEGINLEDCLFKKHDGFEWTYVE